MIIDFYKTKNDNIYIEFLLKKASTPLANGIRRILLNDIPIVSFDMNNIEIKENNTSIHNEFLQHRLSLIPIDNHSFKINTYYDFNKNKRIYNFINNVNIFNLNLKNKNKFENNNNYITVYSKDFTCDNGDNINKYFKPDPIFLPDEQKYIIITYLKVNKNNNESIDISCKPTLGFGRNNACYNPTGTVSYQFVKESKDIINQKLEQYIEYNQKERDNKGLERYNDEEINNLKDDFMLLESDRIYKKNQYKFKIESIGNLYPYELLYNSIIIFQLKLIDLLSNIKLKNQKLIFHKNISIETINNRNNITIINEEHTIGNVINQYITDNYDDYIISSSYKIPHPLNNPKNDLNELVITVLLEENLEPLNDTNKLFYYDNNYNIKKINDNTNHIIYIFEYSIISILKDLNLIKNQINDNYKITSNLDITDYSKLQDIVKIT